MGGKALPATVTVAVIVTVWPNWVVRAGLLVLVFLISGPIVNATKDLVRRERPPKMTGTPGSYSFPSGHALLSAAVYLTAALVAKPYLRKPVGDRLLETAILLVFLIGLSRLYLAVHYPTDVLAGWMGGTALAMICAWLNRLGIKDEGVAVARSEAQE